MDSRGPTNGPIAQLVAITCSAWVFGGMGSWNDVGFDGDDGKEYERVSETLCRVVTQAIAVAANESDSS